MLRLFAGSQSRNATHESDTVEVVVDGRSGKVLYGTSLLFGAWSAGVMLTSACYGHALCAGCLVAVESGNENLSSMKKTEREAIRAHGYPERDEHGHILRLACQTRVFGKVVVHSYPPRGNSVV